MKIEVLECHAITDHAQIIHSRNRLKLEGDLYPDVCPPTSPVGTVGKKSINSIYFYQFYQFPSTTENPISQPIHTKMDNKIQYFQGSIALFSSMINTLDLAKIKFK